MLIAKDSKLVMMGDSVTDAGRSQPVGEGIEAFKPLGEGYPAVVNALLNVWYPALRIRVVNMGTSGNTSRDLLARWERDALAQRPDWLSVCIGINDVWRQFDAPLIVENQVMPDEYETNMRQMLSSARPGVKGLVLMSPYIIEPNPADAMRARMDEYTALCRMLADEYDCLYVDLQQAFTDACQGTHPMAFAWDRIHPNLSGHFVIARAFMKTVGAALT